MTKRLFPRPLWHFAGLSLALGLAAAPVGAATLTSTSATGVTVDGAVYDVDFVPSICTEAGCSDPFTLTFTTLAGATAASTALSDLFEAPGNEDFDDNPSMTNGCQDVEETPCIIFTPYQIQDFAITGFAFYNEPAIEDGGNQWTQLVVPGGGATGQMSFAVWSVAEVTDPAPIPLPGSLGLLAAGLAALTAGRMRRFFPANRSTAGT